MATQASVQRAMAAAHAATAKEAVTAFARLVGLALVISLAVGLLLTAAAVALPAPLQSAGAALAGSGVSGEPPAASLATPGDDASRGALPVDVLVALAAIVLAGLAVKGVPGLRGRVAASVIGPDQRTGPAAWGAGSRGSSPGIELHCHVGRSRVRPHPAPWTGTALRASAGAKPLQ
jgi:hypothetical protein